jgi:Mrp family chromosome partitioning ATPase
VDFVDYVRLFRRRWQIPAACVVVFALLGWFTAAEPTDEPVGGQRYYMATANLRYNPPMEGDGSVGGQSIEQVAAEAMIGQVPTTVAQQLGMPYDEVRDQILGRARPDISYVSVDGVDADAGVAFDLAEATAEVLAQTVNNRFVESYRGRITQLEEDRSEIVLQLDEIVLDEDNPQEDPDWGTYSALAAELSDIQLQLANLDRQGEPSNVLTLLETLPSKSISETQFLSQIEESRNLNDPNEVAQEEELEAPDSAPMGATTRALLGALVGLLLGLGIVVVMDRFDTRLRTKRETEAAFGLPVIAELPPLSRAQKKRPEIMVRTSPRSRIAEAYRAVRTSVLFVAASGAQGASARPNDRVAPSSGPRPWLREERGEALTVLVSSPGPEEGKTSTTANLATLLAEASMRVLVVNCDYRRPRIHRYLEGREVPAPEADAAQDPFDATRGARIIDTSIPGVRLVTGIGEHDPDANPAQVIAAQRKVVEVARRHFDVILLDTAPLLTTNDAVEIISEADLVVMTCRYGKTKREQAELASELLERLSAPVVGVVFVESHDAPQAQYYYYYLDPSGDRRDRRREAEDAADAALAESADSIVRPLRPDTGDDGERRDVAGS